MTGMAVPSPWSRRARQWRRRWRAASYRHTPLATETLRLSTAPFIGRWTSSSQLRAVSWRMPRPSAPRTSASGPRQIDVVQRSRRRLGGADDQDVALLQLAERSREVGDHQVRDRLGRTARDLGDGRVDADRMVLRRDDRVRSRAVGDAQAGAEVVRIRDAVEDQDQRRFAGRLGVVEDVVERMALRDRLDDRDDALVAIVAGQAAQPLVVALDEPDLRLRRAREKLLHALVAPGAVEVQLDHGARCDLHPDADGMETEQQVARHRPMVATSQRMPISTGWCSM